MEKGRLLLASSGKEFQKPLGILSSSLEVKKARKEAMGRLGLDFLESVGGADEMDLDKELAADAEPDGDVEMESVDTKTEEKPPTPTETETRPSNTASKVTSPSKPESPVVPSPTTDAPPIDHMSGLSARERNRLKRKRKSGNAFVSAPPPQSSGAKYNPTPACGPNK
jgi:TATA-binding protein-associated factor